jgi:hypothetical protein
LGDGQGLLWHVGCGLASSLVVSDNLVKDINLC